MPDDLPSPGTYLRKRREAQCLSIDDVAAIFGTVPSVPLATRAAMLESIEADLTPIDDSVITALRKATELGSFRFDPNVLIRLIDMRAGSPLLSNAPRLCRTCACSENDACVEGWPAATCGWRDDEVDLCTACGPDDGDAGEETPPPANVPVNDQLGSAAA
ncbi:XRE family transcriptional regulator [Sphingomonas sp. MG17]|uniref:XRE family transcriptional regulator n=1 Tax=Sphingomonas tagetis TaxID=2949092 RepID=A0A9X2HNW8_9SPHN|nr:XRE family transcriptional regulator [Sphingomonas tagetis]MCP3729285.1 XRE family transcriptional regulator [Sphingomonas tagetis]